MDTFFQWPQDIGVLVREVENTWPYTTEKYKNPTIRPQAALNCPRCKSNNTKFCYYNNYSISQPRYLCKTCKRYWTKGGILRNVPVGGGSRKSKRPSRKKVMISNPSPPNVSPDQNHKIHDVRTLNLDFNPLICNGMSEFGDLPFELNFKNNINPQNPNFFSSCFSHDLPDNSLISIPVYNSNSVFSSSSFHNYMDDIKPSSSFSHDGLENGYRNNLQALQENITSSRTIFPFEELKPISTRDHQFEKELSQGDSCGCWIGMVNGGSW